MAAPFRGAVSGQGLGEALRTTAQRGGVNLWFDRHVDPDQGVEGVALGPTLGEALEQLAAQGHLAVVAADSLLVVGRSAWADRAASAAMAAVPEGTAPPRGDISWPMLTTPEEALQAAVEPFGVPPVAVELPHDLWPALTWTDVEAAAVVALIAASFERWLQIDHGSGRWSDQPLPRRVAVQRSYPAAAATGPVREATQRIDPEARWKSEGARVVLSGTAAAHGPVRAAGRAAPGQRGCRGGARAATARRRPRNVLPCGWKTPRPRRRCGASLKPANGRSTSTRR